MEKGASINLKNKLGDSALILAASKGIVGLDDHLRKHLTMSNIIDYI